MEPKFKVFLKDGDPRPFSYHESLLNKPEFRLVEMTREEILIAGNVIGNPEVAKTAAQKQEERENSFVIEVEEASDENVGKIESTEVIESTYVPTVAENATTEKFIAKCGKEMKNEKALAMHERMCKKCKALSDAAKTE